MSWVYDNKFVIGVGAAMLAGAGVLGYMTLSAKDDYAAASNELISSKGKLDTYMGRMPFPSEEYFKQLASQKQELTDELNKIQEDFKKRVLPVRPISKQAFQDQLKDAVAAVNAGFAKADVEPPVKDFYLGYTEYRDKPPEDAAAPLLARQLRAIELVMELVIREGHLQLKELAREPFAEERSRPRTTEPKPAPPPPKPGPPGPRPPAAGQPARQLVEKTSFSIKIIASDDAFRRIVNGIVGNKKQIFIIRRISVANEKQAPPQKTQAVAAAPPPPPPAGGTSATPAAAPSTQPPPPAANLEYLFGKELVAATIDIEVLDFAEPDKQKPKASDGKTK